MTKLSISFAAAVLSVTFGPAQAYSFAPTAPTATQAAVSAPQVATDADVCVVQVTPLLVTILALPDDWQGQGTQAQTALACAED